MNKQDLEKFRNECRDAASAVSGIPKDLYRGSEDTTEETGNEVDGHHENGNQKSQAKETPENKSRVISIKAKRRRCA